MPTTKHLLPAKLTPKVLPWMTDLMEQTNLLSELLKTYGSPVNIHHTGTFQDNIENFKAVFKRFDINSQIYYARKANKTKALAKLALMSHIGIDTTSFNELNQAIELGGNTETLVLTSAIKTDEQVELAIRNNVVIIIDNDDESQRISNMAKVLNKRAKVGIRVSGFLVEGEKLYSRFGFDVDEVVNYTRTHFGLDNVYENLDITGLHFHLDGYSIKQRGLAAIECITIAKQLRASLHPITFVDMGGGILINYLENKEEWNTFQDQLIQQMLTDDDLVTFNGNGLGFEKIDGKLNGKLKTYPYYNTTNSTKFLKQVLETKHPMQDKSLAEMAKQHNIQLRIEPGRSLLDGVGMTVARVAHRKKDSKGQYLVGLEMNMTQMMTSSEDFLIDPFVLYRNKADDYSPLNSSQVVVNFTGAYCLERDLILKRKIVLERLPKVGDLVIFVNTAGYFMHFFETEAHLFELSKNLIYESKKPISLLNFIDDDIIE